MRIGVLALQGGFAPHLAALRAIGMEPVEVRRARDLDGCRGIVLPGGESPAQLRLLERDPELTSELVARIEDGLPLLATCAGLILAAREVRNPSQRSFGWIDVRVRRNAWGRQVHSAEAMADDGETPLVLIRAPRIESVGARASIELTLKGEPVLVREGPRFGATFHPELTPDRRLYERVLAPVVGAVC
ncbi:MAG TPA: pyridoxal 5'-phosphate synthase glutaminase subunit PdxT [Sandaracinaceae bacterium]